MDSLRKGINTEMAVFILSKEMHFQLEKTVHGCQCSSNPICISKEQANAQSCFIQIVPHPHNFCW